MHAINNITFTPNTDGTVTINFAIEAGKAWTVSTERAREIWRNEAKLVKNPLQDGVEVKSTDRCPQHNTPSKNEYRIGMYDATVITYKGCDCAVCVGFMNDTSYFKSYVKAQSQAKYISHKMAS